MSLADAFAPADAEYRSRVIHATFGHLAPEENRVYSGSIIFAESAFGDTAVLSYKFDGLLDSPWFAQNLFDFIFKHDCEYGMVYLFSGTYTMDEEGNGTFAGTITPKPVSELFSR